MEFSDYDELLKYLDGKEIELSTEEESLLAEVMELNAQIDAGQRKTLLKDLGDAAMHGVENYINSFIDISETMDQLKNPKSIQNQAGESVARKQGDGSSRTLYEAGQSPFSGESKQDHSQMSDSGRRQMEFYVEEYKQRVKTIGEHQKSNKFDTPESNEALAGLESYRFGPKVSVYTPDEFKQMYESENPSSIATWVRSKNYDLLAQQCAKEFGFPNKSAFETWRRENKLTPHETREGIFLIPSDVHDTEIHAGYQCAVNKYLTGKRTKDDLETFESNVRRKFIYKEVSTRGTRALKGVGMSALKTLIQKLAGIIVNETYKEFKQDSPLPFTERIKKLCKACYERVKRELKSIFEQIRNGAVCSIATEALYALNDFVFKTAKNIIRIIRSMIGSIIRAMKVIFSKGPSWKEKVYEAMKILSAGFAAALGFGLNEIISKFIVLNIPPLAFASNIIADILSGLFACIMSSLILTMFDSYKDRIALHDQIKRSQLLNMQLMYCDVASLVISDVRTKIAVDATRKFVAISIDEVVGILSKLDDIEKRQTLLLAGIGSGIGKMREPRPDDKRARISENLMKLKTHYEN